MSRCVVPDPETLAKAYAYQQQVRLLQTAITRTLREHRLCTKSRSFIGFLGVKISLSGLEKAFKMRLKRSC